MLQLLLELPDPALQPLHHGGLLVQPCAHLMVLGDLGAVRSLRLSGALIAAPLLVGHAAQFAVAPPHLVGEILHLALDRPQLAGLLLGLGKRAAHLVEVELDGLQLPAQPVDQALALAQGVVARGVRVHGNDRAPVGAPAAAVGLLVAERAYLQEPLRRRVLVQARGLANQKVAPAESAACGVLGDAGQIRPPPLERTWEHTAVGEVAADRRRRWRVQQPAGVLAAAPSAAPAATAEGSVSMFNCTMPACLATTSVMPLAAGRTQAPTGVGCR